MVRAGNRPDGEIVSRSFPGFEDQIHSSHSIGAIVAELVKLDVDASAALEGTDLTISHLDSHATRVSYRQLDNVIRNALNLSSDSAIALHAGRRIHVTSYGMYGYPRAIERDPGDDKDASRSHSSGHAVSSRSIRRGDLCNLCAAGRR
ncbi:MULTISPECIES: AraC family transcriptional regulator ligand-binding domain-containing protein [Bradyrhizobium]